MPSIVTLKDIAEAAGYSKATISLALRNDPRLKTETCEKVQAVAKKMGYVPNTELSAMASRHWSHRKRDLVPLAYISNEAKTPKDQSAYWLGASAQAQHKGYMLDYFRVDDLSKSSKFMRTLYNRGIRGVILSQFEGKLYDLIDDENMLYVSCASVPSAKVCHSVNYDQFSAVHTCCEEARKRGYKRIAIAPMRHEIENVADHMRLFAVKAWQDSLPKEQRLELFYDDMGNKAGFLQWFDRVKPDAVITFHMGAYFWLKDYGVNIPKDVGFAAFSMGSNDYPEISGTHIHNDVIGAMAIDVLDIQLRGHYANCPVKSFKLVTDVNWHEGKSLKKKVR